MTIGVRRSPILVLIEVARRWRSTTRRTDAAAV